MAFGSAQILANCCRVGREDRIASVEVLPSGFSARLGYVLFDSMNRQNFYWCIKKLSVTGCNDR